MQKIGKSESWSDLVGLVGDHQSPRISSRNLEFKGSAIASLGWKVRKAGRGGMRGEGGSHDVEWELELEQTKQRDIPATLVPEFQNVLTATYLG